MKKKNGKRLNLTKETLNALDKPELLRELAGAAGTGCPASECVCSIRHTCWSCQYTEEC